MGIRDSKPMVAEDNEDFMRFWNLFPRRSSKKEARIAWAALNPNAETVDKILNALAWQIEQPDWLREAGRFVPYPASYLRAERWKDERHVVRPSALSSAVGDPMQAWLSRKKAVGE